MSNGTQYISHDNSQKPDIGKKSAFTRRFLYRSPGLANDTIQATDKERLAKSTISAPISLTNAAWRLSQMSPPSALVVSQISFRGNPG
jgi:hypothetical protein